MRALKATTEKWDEFCNNTF